MRILLFADIHIGSIKDVEYVYNTITDIIDAEVKLIKTDMIVILGDYFHRLFKVNEEFTSLAINVMSYIVRICKQTSTKIRIIYGTESHEMNQYKLFNYHINSPNLDFKVIDKLSDEIIDGKRILYMPEEYTDDQSYYDDVYSNKYDYIFGHGVIIEGMPAIVSKSSNKNISRKVHHFKSKQLHNMCKICVFGHYHNYTKVTNNVYYLGSLFRDSFGEESPKGYGIITNGKLEFVENTEAYIYKTYTIDVNDNSIGGDEILSEINRIKDENVDIYDGDKHGKIRIIIESDNEIQESVKEQIKSIVGIDENIKHVFDEKVDNDILDDIPNEFEFILDKTIPIENKIHKYINMKYNIPMDIDKLKYYIT